MAELPVPFSSSALGLTRVVRRAAKEIALNGAATSVVVAQAEAKIDAIGSVTETAVLSCARVGLIELMAASQTPHAAGRYRYLGDSGAASMGAVIHGMARRL
jgi:ketopantoate hydroxymethyltransferase